MFPGLGVEFESLRRHAGRGQAMVEYTLILVLVAVVVIAVLVSLGTGINNTFNAIIDKLK